MNSWKMKMQQIKKMKKMKHMKNMKNIEKTLKNVGTGRRLPFLLG